jgi:hypothetical protein
MMAAAEVVRGSANSTHSATTRTMTATRMRMLEQTGGFFFLQLFET